MKRKEALDRIYDRHLFADVVDRYVHRSEDAQILTMYFCQGKSIMEISHAIDRSTRHIWEVKEKYVFLFDIYDKLYPE